MSAKSIYSIGGNILNQMILLKQKKMFCIANILLYLQQPNTVVFTMISTVKRTEFQLSSPIFVEVLTYLAMWLTLRCMLAVQTSRKIKNNIAKLANFGNNYYVWGIKFGSFNGRDHGGCNGVGFMERSQTFMIQHSFFIGTISFDRQLTPFYHMTE